MSLTGDTEDEDSASTSSSLKRGNKDLKKRKMEENTSINLSKQESFTSIKKPKRDDAKDLALCRYYFRFMYSIFIASHFICLEIFCHIKGDFLMVCVNRKT